ncbi:MAG: Na+-transporting NADH:ubiquinone oxidoreductase subunit A [Mariniblastus sp.]
MIKQARFATWIGHHAKKAKHMVYQLKEGLDLPISGKPVQDILPGSEVKSVAILADDYVGMRPTMLVNEGDSVSLGQPVFADKKTEGVIFTSPGSGTVTAINRGPKRKFESIEIELNGDAEVTFESFSDLANLDRETIESQMINAGVWPALRTRPFSRTPALGSEAHSIFVTAMDTNPLAAEPELIIAANSDLFIAGLRVISKLTPGKTYVCTRDDSRVPGENVPNVTFEQFQGPHPAGLPGTHIHLLDPVGPNKTVWQIGYQDVIAVGNLFTTGKIMTERVISIAGPQTEKPGLYKTRLGANLDEAIQAANPNLSNARIVSGSVLSGRTSEPMKNYLGRFHDQIVVLEEGTKREFLGWQKPGFDKFSITKVYGGSWLKGKLFPLTTSTGGSKRSMVPVETYERVMPLDVLPTQLLRALISGDTEESQLLGALELSEEDLALCTYVCPGKYEYGSILRENLTLIEKEG